MALAAAILTVYRRGWSRRRIVRELGECIEPPSLATSARPSPRHAQPKAPIGSEQAQHRSNAANAPIGSEAPPGHQAGSGLQPPRFGTGRASICEPCRQIIADQPALVLTAQRNYHDLVIEHDCGGYYSVRRRLVRRLEAPHQRPFRRLASGPGQEAQVDFGTGAPILLPDGRRRRTSDFRIVLSHFRKAYSEVVLRPALLM